MCVLLYFIGIGFNFIVVILLYGISILYSNGKKDFMWWSFILQNSLIPYYPAFISILTHLITDKNKHP